MWNWDANTITTTNFTYWNQSQVNNNFYFLLENNASTSFFTHFYSFNFIYTAYFVKNYFLFTSYMKYFYLWRVSIVTVLNRIKLQALKLENCVMMARTQPHYSQTLAPSKTAFWQKFAAPRVETCSHNPCPSCSWTAALTICHMTDFSLR